MPSADCSFVESQIRAAVAGVSLGSGVSVRQAQIMDNYGRGVSDEEFASLPLNKITDSRAEVSLSELERDCVAHLADNGLRYYLPAMTLALLDHYDRRAV